jgi:hypothetical protein
MLTLFTSHVFEHQVVDTNARSMPAANIPIRVVEHHTTPTRMDQRVGDILGGGCMVVAKVEVYD